LRQVRKQQKTSNNKDNSYKALQIYEEDFDTEDGEDTDNKIIAAIKETRPRTSKKDEATRNDPKIKAKITKRTPFTTTQTTSLKPSTRVAQYQGTGDRNPSEGKGIEF
jgi:hypothetical protein